MSDVRPSLIAPDAPSVIEFDVVLFRDGQRCDAKDRIRGVQIGLYAVVGHVDPIQVRLIDVGGQRRSEIRQVDTRWFVYHVPSGFGILPVYHREQAYVVADTLSTFGPDCESSDIQEWVRRMDAEAPLLKSWLTAGAPGDFREWRAGGRCRE